MSTKYSVKDVLLVSAYFTSQEGYHPVSAGSNSTKIKVIEYLDSHQPSPTQGLEEYQQRAEKAVHWVKQEPQSDWIDSIKKALTLSKEVEAPAIGIISSLYSGYDLYLKREEEKKSLLKSEYQGTPKSPYTFHLKSFRILTKGKSKYNDSPFYLTQLIDTEGNVYIWFAPQDHTDSLKLSSEIKCIVKSHNERDGVKQTVIDVKEM